MGSNIMDYLYWLNKHMALECIQLDEHGDLARLQCEVPEPIPRLYVAQYRERYHLFFRNDVPTAVRKQLRTLPLGALLSEYDLVSKMLDPAELASEGTIWRGKSYIYVEEPDFDLPTQIEYFDEKDRCAIVIDGVLAAQCMSVRSNLDASEAYVETHPDFRRRALGKQIVFAWAQRVRQSGRTPFYSHHVDNIASQRLADSLGLVWFIDDIAYE